MASKELIEQVGLIVYKAKRHDSNHEDAAAEIISTIRAALQEPTENFDPEKVSYHKGMTRLDWWRAMLNASALGEQSE